MFVRIDVVTPPAEEPVTRDELKTHAKVTDPSDAGQLSAQNAALDRALVTARRRCEKFTRRSLMTQVLDVWYDTSDGVGYIVLPRGHVQNVVSVTTYDDVNEDTIADTAGYDLVGSDLIFTDWLPYFREHLGLKIRITSGYGDDPEDVPEPLRQGILEYATHLWDNPGGEGPDVKYEAQTRNGGVGLPAGVLDKWGAYQIPIVP
jgi:uncharacterized phiE125 gp8 family phage protein